MKLSTALKISLMLIILGLLASCASSNQPVYRSSVPTHCTFENRSKQSNPKKIRRTPEAPPSKTTPIGGNFSVRH
jgi:hypothetical protein